MTQTRSVETGCVGSIELNRLNAVSSPDPATKRPGCDHLYVCRAGLSALRLRPELPGSRRHRPEEGRPCERTAPPRVVALSLR
jgi:hypothetical protein